MQCFPEVCFHLDFTLQSPEFLWIKAHDFIRGETSYMLLYGRTALLECMSALLEYINLALP